MPQPTVSSAIARFGGKALPATGALQSFINLNDAQQWFLQDFTPGDSNRQVGTAQLLWRGRGVYLSDDFGAGGVGRLVTLPLRYFEGTTFGGAGNPLAQQLGLITQAGEQYLTFDNKTYLLARYRAVKSRKLLTKYPPLWHELGLEFVCKEPWAKDFQASGSLANLLNPYGGFEGPAVQPTLYASTIVQSNDFETAGSITDLWHSIGTEALGTLAGWNQVAGAWSAASNVVTGPTNQVDAVMTAGHADWADGTYFERFKWTTGGSVARAVVHFASAGNYIAIQADGGNLTLYQVAGGVFTSRANPAAVLTSGNWYWFKVNVTGNVVTAQIFTDSPAGTMSATQVGTNATYTFAFGGADSAIATGQVGIGTSSSAGTAAQFGGAFANVCYFTGPFPFTNILGGGTWGQCGEPAFCWSGKQWYYGTSSTVGHSISVYRATACANGVTPYINMPAVSLTNGQTYFTSVATLKTSGTTLTSAPNWAGFGAGNPGDVTADGAWHTGSAAWLDNQPTGNQTFSLAFTTVAGTGTIYWDYVVVFQPPAPTGVLFNSLGAALGGFTPTGTLAAWTTDSGAPSIASNQLTVPVGASLHSGHADWWDCTPLERFQYATGLKASVICAHYVNANNRLYGYVDGTNLILGKIVAGVNTAVQTVAAALTGGSWYWMKFQCSGTTYTVTLYKDAGGYPADQVAQATGTITDAAVQLGVVQITNNEGGSTAALVVGGNYPGTFMVQGPVPTGMSVTWLAGEPAFCWSKNAPHGGTYSISVFNNDAGANGYASEAFTAATATYNYQGYIKASGAGTASLNVGGAGLKSVTQDNTWRQTADANIVTSAGANTVRFQLNGAGTAYFDDAVLQQSFDSLTGLYSQAFVDRVALAGSTGAGTTTTFTVTYAGSVFTEPLWQVNIPATNTVPISSITIVNQTTGVGLTINFSTPLAANTAYTLQIDCAALTVAIGTTQYDWTAPGGAKCGFPFLFPGANTMAVTVVTSSGTSTGVSLDESVTNRWEL